MFDFHSSSVLCDGGGGGIVSFKALTREKKALKIRDFKLGFTQSADKNLLCMCRKECSLLKYVRYYIVRYQPDFTSDHLFGQWGGKMWFYCKN